VKKNNAFFILICLFFLLISGCTYNGKDSLPIISSEDFFSDDAAFLKDKIIMYQDHGLFSDYFKDYKIEEYLIEYDASCIYVDANKNAYLQISSSNNINNEFGIYSLTEKVYTPLVTLDQGHQVAIKAVNDNFIIWKEDKNSNWYKTSLHVYNLKTKKDTEFYVHTVDPETDMVYEWNFNKPVLKDDIVYFDDIVGIKDDIYQINLFQYNITEDKLEKIKTQAKYPMLYNDEIAWLGYRKKDNGTTIVVNNNGKPLEIAQIKSSGGLFQMSSSKNIIAIIEGINIPDYDIITSLAEKTNNENPKEKSYSEKETLSQIAYGVKIFDGKTAEPVMVSKDPVDTPDNNGKYIGWRQFTKDYPRFYDVENKRIITVDKLSPEKVYGCLINQKYLIFDTYNNSDPLNKSISLYIIDLDPS
jgi:hypothetical protein